MNGINGLVIHFEFVTDKCVFDDVIQVPQHIVLVLPEDAGGQQNLPGVWPGIQIIAESKQGVDVFDIFRRSHDADTGSEIDLHLFQLEVRLHG